MSNQPGAELCKHGRQFCFECHTEETKTTYTTEQIKAAYLKQFTEVGGRVMFITKLDTELEWESFEEALIDEL